MENQEETKICKVCGETRGIDDFKNAKSCIGGKSHTCMPCARLYQKQWHAKNYSSKKERAAKRAAENLTTMHEKQCPVCNLIKPRSDYHINSFRSDGMGFRCKACQANYYNDNKRVYQQRSVEYGPRRVFLQNNRTDEYKKVQRNKRNIKRLTDSRVIARENKRRASKLRATPKWADLDKITKIYDDARVLGRKEHHVDHIVPLQSDLVCGLHNEFNLQVLPALKNLSKGNRYWPDMPDPE